jgi:hypothetical protein
LLAPVGTLKKENAVPNGHTGGFLIPKSELTLLLTSLADTTVVGLAVGAFARAKRAGTTPEGATVCDLLRHIGEFPGENVLIEEQDNSYYVIHLDREVQDVRDPVADKWIVVDSKSPLFTSFRERHEANLRRYSALRRNRS